LNGLFSAETRKHIKTNLRQQTAGIINSGDRGRQQLVEELRENHKVMGRGGDGLIETPDWITFVSI